MVCQPLRIVAPRLLLSHVIGERLCKLARGPSVGHVGERRERSARERGRLDTELSSRELLDGPEELRESVALGHGRAIQ